MSGRIKAARAGYMGDAGYKPAMPGTGYMGDPGLFGFLGKAIRGVAGAALGVASNVGIPGASRIQQAISRRAPAVAQQVPFGFRITSGGNIVRDVSARQSVFGRAGGGGRLPNPLGITRVGGGMPGPPLLEGKGTSFVPDQYGNCPVGHHKNKTGYWITSPQGTPSYVSPGERCVKNRRRNPLNPRATDRAISRLESAKKAVGKIGRVSIRKKCPT